MAQNSQILIPDWAYFRYLAPSNLPTNQLREKKEKSSSLRLPAGVVLAEGEN